MKNSVILRQAKQIILEDGWVQGVEGMDVSGPACLLGAVGRAAGVPTKKRPGYMGSREYEYIDMSDVIPLPAVKALTDCIVQVQASWERTTPSDVVWRFNDRTRRTQEEVVKVLNDCANKEEEAGR